jgi:hypothetical protein
MTLVTNNTVKMEWDKSLWLQAKAKNGIEGAFFFAGKKYNSSKFGEISVGFTSISCFLFAENGGQDISDFSTAEEMKDLMKEDINDFPLGYEEHIPLNDTGTADFFDDVLEKYGLLEYKEDLVARMKDVNQYATVEED